MNDFIASISELIGRFSGLAYLATGLAAMLESSPIIGLFTPGVVVMVIAGFAASEGLLSLPNLLIIAAVGGFIGEMISYYFGFRLRSSFHSKHRFLKPEYLAKAEAFIKRRGLFGIFLGRFIGPLRSTTSIVAGMSSVSLPTFSLIGIFGSFFFFAFHIILGYVAGSAWQTIEDWSSRAGIFLFGLVVFFAIVWWLKNFFVAQGKVLKQLSATAILWLYESCKFRTGSVWARGLNPKEFSGLPRVTLFLSTLLFFGITIAIGYSTQVFSGIDARFAFITSLLSNPDIAAAAFLLTTLASASFVMALSIAACFWFFLEKRLSYSIALLTSVIGTFVSASVLKFFIARQRPEPTFYFENFYAYPSLHAALAFASLMFLAYYAIRAYPRWSRNVSLVLIVSTLVLLIGLSRVYLGVHYLSDILGGFCLAVAWFQIAIIVQRFFENHDAPRRYSKNRQLIMLSGMALLLFAVYMTLTFDRGKLKSFDYQKNNARKPIIALLQSGTWPTVTENLRGGRLRQVAGIIRADEAQLKAALSKDGWTERQAASLASISDGALSLLLKKDTSRAPLRLRFWHNQANNFTFTKADPRGDHSDVLILRLWYAALADSGEIVFVAELSINRDFSWPLPSSESLVEPARQELIDYLSKQHNITIYDMDL